MSRTSSTLRMGLLLYAKGVTDRWQRREGYKCKKRGGWYSYLYSAPYLTLTAGDKGIKCPSESPEQCRKGPLGAPPFATMAILSASHATAHRWLHSLPPRAPGEAPRATRWWMRWSVGAEWPPAAASALPLLLSCRVRKLVAHRASRYLGWSSRQAPLAGALLPCRSAWRVAASSLERLGWPSRQAPLAGVLSP